MTRPAVLTRRAAADLKDALAWIAAENPDSARNLRSAVADAARRLGLHPTIGARRPRLLANRSRVWPLPRCPYLLIYTAETMPPRILRVVHMARDLPKLLADLKA